MGRQLTNGKARMGSKEDSEDDDGHPIMRVEWFPLSQVNEIHNTDPATIKVSSWIMRQKRATWK